MKEFFSVDVSKYSPEKAFTVVRPSSLNDPKDNSVMFVTEAYLGQCGALKDAKNCLVFWPTDVVIPEELADAHAFVPVDNPRVAFAEFFRDNDITNHGNVSEYRVVNGAYICVGAKIGENTLVFPGAYIDDDVVIGSNCFIGSGAKLMGRVRVGDGCVIKENAVIGADSLTVTRDAAGKIVTVPQFGGVVIEENVQIGVLAVIGRGAIDDTIIHSGSRISNGSYISHNVVVGYDSLILGEVMMFGSSSVGNNSMISGNATVRDGVHIGSHTTVGMAAVVTKNVPDNTVVMGCPAKPVNSKG